MQITIYTIKDCPFCKAEKDFLTVHNLPFTEKNVEENREFLSEMLEASDKFAGVPFTMIVKDDGTKIPLKGFTESEFMQALGLSAPANDSAQAIPAASEPVPAAQPVDTMPPVEQPSMQQANADITLPPMPEDKPVEPSAPEPVAPTMPVEPVVPTVPPEPLAPSEPAMPETPTAPMQPPASAPAAPTTDDLQGVLNNLSAMAGVNPTPTPTPEPNPEPPMPEPSTPTTEEPSSTIDHGTDMNNPTTPSQPTVPNVPDLPQG